MGDIFGFVSIIVLGCGVYGLYAYIQMRRTGHINETLLLGKTFTEAKCKDKETYMKKSMPAVLIFGIVTTLYGVVDVIHYYVTPLDLLDVIAMIAFGIMLAWYLVYTTKLRNKYF